ncbi:MAG: signal peptide peptidase SppA [Lentisphaerae bacterium]|nr:signal peptide peptidase SppA [Lentisphaerota bacterium]
MEKLKNRNGCLWVLVVLQSIAMVIVLVFILAISLLSRSCQSVHARKPIMGVDENPDLNEIWSYGNGKTKVVLIPLRGIILFGEERFFGHELGSAYHALMAIRRATHDPNVRAIIMDIDSPGGGITASDILYKALINFKQSMNGRKVISLLGDVAASGGYYVAAASDHIIAHPTTITGSIGVLMQSLNVKELGLKLGVKDVTIKSGNNKDILNPFEDLSPEQYSILQNIVDEMHSHFVSIVASGRNMSTENVLSLADGQVYTSKKALSMGLIDQIGYWEDAAAKTAELLLVDDIQVFRYENSFSLLALLRAYQPFRPSIRNVWEAAQTRIMYLWKP